MNQHQQHALAHPMADGQAMRADFCRRVGDFSVILSVNK